MKIASRVCKIVYSNSESDVFVIFKDFFSPLLNPGSACGVKIKMFIYLYEHLLSASSQDEPKTLHTGNSVRLNV